MKITLQPLKDKRLVFAIAFTWILMIWASVIAMPSNFRGDKGLPDFLYQFKAAGLLTVYIVIALYIEKKTGDYKRVFSQIWRIDKLVNDPQECLNLIIDELNINVDLFDETWKKWGLRSEEKQTSVAARNNILTKQTLQERTLNAVMRIANGELTIPEVIWIFIYQVYIFTISTNIMKINAPLDGLTSTAFFLVLGFTNKTKGLGGFLKELRGNLMNLKDKEFEVVLETIRRKILALCRDYYLVDNVISRVNQQFTSQSSNNNDKTGLNNTEVIT